MKNHSGRLTGLSACCLILAFNGCDTVDVEHDAVDDAVQYRTSDREPNFQCDTSGINLEPWTASGMDLDHEIQSKFKLWKTMNSSCVPSEVKAKCDNPPSEAYSPAKPKYWGGVSRGDIVVAQEKATIYRAFSTGPFTCSVDRPADDSGSWWALTMPGGSQEAYRDNYAICPQWNNLSKIRRCEIPAGTALLVGPTQSADCEPLPDGCQSRPEGWPRTLPATRSPQVFLNLHGRTDFSDLLLDCCEMDWPFDESSCGQP
ncbi:MAG: hypothetical protein K0V04_19225 [Deltaproteobacteria bacterium]|nr:hypothetical protein [Deltaproteobacteria bacterium]